MEENGVTLDSETRAKLVMDSYMIFERLNINDDEKSKGKLETKEIMNFFYSMDNFNGQNKVDGEISQYEFQAMNLAIANSEKSNINSQKAQQLLINNYNKHFKDYE